MLTRPAIAGTRRPSRGGGFSLVELIAVMVMITILAAVAVPALSSVDESRAAMAGRQLLRDISFARQHAIATGTITWVKFDTTGDTSWQVEAETGAAGKSNAVLLNDPATSGTFVQDLNTPPFADVKVLTAVFTGDDVTVYTDIGFDWLGQPITNDGVLLDATGVVTLTGSNVVNVFQETGYAEYVAP